jgi:hypothetical protein
VTASWCCESARRPRRPARRARPRGHHRGAARVDRLRRAHPHRLVGGACRGQAGVAAVLLGSAGLAACIALVALTYHLAVRMGIRFLDGTRERGRPGDLAGRFAASLVPVVVYLPAAVPLGAAGGCSTRAASRWTTRNAVQKAPSSLSSERAILCEVLSSRIKTRCPGSGVVVVPAIVRILALVLFQFLAPREHRKAQVGDSVLGPSRASRARPRTDWPRPMGLCESPLPANRP